MAIVINVEKQKALDFDILGHNFKVYTDDETLEKVTKAYDEAKEMSESKEIEPYREKIKDSFEALFGEGVFDQIEKLISDDGRKYTIQMLHIYMQVSEEVVKKIQDDAKPIMEKYKAE